MPIDPVEPAYREMLARTKGCYPVEDNRGPLVFEVTQDESVNGVAPDSCNCVEESMETDKEE